MEYKPLYYWLSEFGFTEVLDRVDHTGPSGMILQCKEGLWSLNYGDTYCWIPYIHINHCSDGSYVIRFTVLPEDLTRIEIESNPSRLKVIYLGFLTDFGEP